MDTTSDSVKRRPGVPDAKILGLDAKKRWGWGPRPPNNNILDAQNESAWSPVDAHCTNSLHLAPGFLSQTAVVKTESLHLHRIIVRPDT